MTHTRSRPLVVLGGGIAGLGAAWEAIRAGLDVELFESSETPGGMLRTDRVDGFNFDHGGHRFLTAIPWVLERMTELVGSRFLLRERRSFVLLDGRRVEYPLRLANLVRQLGLKRNARALLSFAAARCRVFGRPREETLEDWLRLRFGDYLYRFVFAGYSEKLWGVRPDQLSAEWAPQRISVPSLAGFLKQMLWPAARPPRSWARRFLYPKTGIGEIVERMVEAVREGGGRLHCSSRAVEMRREQGGWQVTVRSPAGIRTLAAAGVVSTIPVDALAELLPPGSAANGTRLPRRGLRFLNLGFDHPLPLDATWIYQPDPAVRFSRVQVPAARSPFMVPSGCGSIQMEAPDSGAGVSLEVRVREALEVLRRTGFEASAPVLAFETFEADAYPVYSPAARRRRAELLEWLATQPQLRSVGRQGRFSYVFLDRAFAEGVNAARTLLEMEPLPVEEGPPGAPLPLEAHSLLERPEKGPNRRSLHASAP